MTGLGTGLILLLLFLFRTGSCNYAEILWGQCYAFCLTQHESRLYGEDNVDHHGMTIKKCRRDKVCKGCLHACERPRDDYRYQDSCFAHCQKARPKDNLMGLQACNASCRFIHQSLTVKFGSCPPIVGDDKDEDGDSGGTQVCEAKCERDVDCDDMLKCCTQGCGKKCLRPLEWNSFPPIPTPLKFKLRQDGSTLVEWEEAKAEKSDQLVLYVLRWWCSYTDGVITSITTKLKLRLKGYNHPDGLHPGHKCHFMLAGVNQYGSQGFSSPQQYAKKFLRPSKPGNLETVKSSKLRNNKVNITIQWQPPLYTDNLPISRYLVLWSDPLPKAIPEYERRQMHNKTLDGDKTTYTITNLEPGTVYFVQVRAVVSWKRRSIKGDPVSTYVETHAVPRAAGPIEEEEEREMKANSVVQNITVSKPAFVQSQLKAVVTWQVQSDSRIVKYMLYWAPEECMGEANHRKTRNRLRTEATTHKQEFLLYNLFPNCRYELRIHAVHYSGGMDEGRPKHFQTLPCSETEGSAPDLCPAEVSPPLSPVKVSLRYKTSTSSRCVCQAVISWTHQTEEPYTSSQDPTPSVSLWNIVWGESRPPSGGSITASGSSLISTSTSTLFQAATIVYNTSPYETQVSMKETKACLTYLEKSKHYTVQIIGQTGQTKGKPAVFHFFTPDYISNCYIYPDGMDPTSGEETKIEGSMEQSTAKMDSSHQGKGSGGILLCRPNDTIVLIMLAVCFLLTGCLL